MQVLINLANNLGLNSQSMEASSGFNFDSNKTESLGYLKQNTNMSNILKEIKTISTAGSNLADKLYKGINGIFSNLTNIINTEIPSLNNLVKYKELTDIFDSTFSLDNLKEVPFEFIDESSNLVNKLEQIYKGINDGSLKKNIVILNECIYHFITQSHLLIDKIYNNLDELSYLINSPKETISVISTYYLNHTSSSYISTIEKASQILLNYYENEVILKINLEEEKEYVVKGYNGDVKIKAGNGKIKVVEETSEKHLCSKQGYIKESYETIVCLPNKIVIKITSDDELDATL